MFSRWNRVLFRMNATMGEPGLVFRGSGVKSSSMTPEEKFNESMKICGECIKPEELLELFKRKPHPICYDGFEPSGRMHIAQGVLKAINVNRLTSSGCIFIFWIADWFAVLNNKMGGDLTKIRTLGRYFIEVWKASGMDMENVRFVWTSDEINEHPDSYWTRVMDIARSFNIARIKRCGQIMGRSEGDDQPAAQIFYPCMQCADIFHLKADICQLGLDQRKVNVLAREYADMKKMRKNERPIILSHALIPGLLEGQEKMSKSNPDSAIFMEDSEAEVNRKIKKAFCPPQTVEGNPCIGYVEAMVLPRMGVFRILRRDAEELVVKTSEELRSLYSTGVIHPGDLKPALARHLNEILEPVRRHFTENPEAAELLKQIKAFK